MRVKRTTPDSVTICCEFCEEKYGCDVEVTYNTKMKGANRLLEFSKTHDSCDIETDERFSSYFPEDYDDKVKFCEQTWKQYPGLPFSEVERLWDQRKEQQ